MKILNALKLYVATYIIYIYHKILAPLGKGNPSYKATILEQNGVALQKGDHCNKIFKMATVIAILDVQDALFYI